MYVRACYLTRYGAGPIRSLADKRTAGCSASATIDTKRNRWRLRCRAFFTLYQAIERLRRKLQLRSADVLHLRIGK